ncbi:uncharacterized protein LOC127577890 [Pristis pectinata]|uniref:uncharacterized protein LOC127577890 n=1 Tax=Pristis pectinata TaxID=685728 RepID=UPI00223D3E84|nr:uncharacterized protein LOC127577890 [Pristis pectinata]
MGRTGASPRLLVPAAIALLVLLPPSEGNLKLRASKSPVEVILNENGLLQCEIANLTGITLNPKNLGILWVFIRGTEKLNIFIYSDGQITSLWKEAELSENAIQDGNMSLLLKNITFKHSGEYQCEVVIPPNDKDSLMVKLEVLARPTVTVVSEKVVEVGNGGEMVLGCQLNGYYPCESKTEWFQSNPSQAKTKLLTDICIAPPIKNPDGTCNVTTEVQLEPHVEDIGSSFECRVTHKTFPEPYTVTAAVTLKEAEIRLSTRSIVGSVIASIIISVLLIAAGIFLYMRYYYKVPPKVSDIQLSPRILHQELAKVTCHVSGFRPDVINVGWYLRRQNGTEEKFIGEHKKGQLVALFGKEKKINETGQMSEIEGKWKISTITSEKNSDGTHSLSCTLEVYPDIMEDNRAEIICRVKHPAGSEEKCIQFYVNGIAPKLANIIQPPVVHHNRSVMLTCPINFFKPRTLTIKWYEKINGVKSLLLDYNTGDEVISSVGRYSHRVNEFSYPDHTYSVHSILFFNATIEEDDGKEYCCEVNHMSLEHPAEQWAKLEVKALPSLNTILCEPVNPEMDKELTLSCKVHSFYPKSIIVHWFKDKKAIKDVETSEIIENPDKLYELTTTCTIIPTLSDIESKYQCQVNHESLIHPRFVEYIPENLVSPPKVNEISCDPVNPEIGKSLTLACEINEFYPEGIQIDWFRDDVRITEITKYGIINEELWDEHGLYNKVTKLTLTPSTDDHQAEYRVEVYHSKSSSKPQKQCFQLFLEGLPKFSDFKMEPKIPSYGHHLSVSYSVHDLLSKNVTFEWYKGSEPVKGGITNSDFVCTHQKTYRVESCLNFLVTAEDFEKDLIFLCKDHSKGEELKRLIQLPLKAIPPKVSEIKCDPVQPKMGENATLTCSIEHFCPMDIDVVWSKGWNEYIKQQIVELPKINEKGLYSTITKLPIVVTGDSEDYVCEIRHAKTNDIVEKTFKLQI